MYKKKINWIVLIIIIVLVIAIIALIFSIRNLKIDPSKKTCE